LLLKNYFFTILFWRATNSSKLNRRSLYLYDFFAALADWRTGTNSVVSFKSISLSDKSSSRGVSGDSSSGRFILVLETP